MGILTKINSFVKSIDNLESISATLQNNIVTEKRGGFFPSNYYFLTHLVNPAHSFWSKKFPNIQKSKELAKKLLLGRRLGLLAGAWFRKLPNFFVEEGKLDGIFMDIPGVRGSIDFKIGDSIIEFKTKNELPKSVKELFRRYPQDIEQIAFYSVLHPSKPSQNYLVFMNNIRPYKIKAFKLITLDFGKIKDLILRRIKLLNEAFKNNDPSKLGQCRYYQEHCQFEENTVCKCSDMEPLSTQSIRSAIKIYQDDKFTKLLESEKEKSTIPNNMFTTFHIIAPRKCIMERKMGIEEQYQPDSIKEEHAACLGNLVRKLRMQLTPEQSEYIKNSINDSRIYIAHRWLNVISSIKPKGELLPYLIKVSRTNETLQTKNPNEYAIAELGIICAAYNKVKGLIFMVYPNLKDLIKVYEIMFNDLNALKNLVKDHVDKLEKAFETGDVLSVEGCPTFMNNNGNCPLMDVCHAKENTGCLR